MSIHKNYANFEEERPEMQRHVDNMYNLIYDYAEAQGLDVDIDDNAERVVEAIATWLVIGEKNAKNLKW